MKEKYSKVFWVTVIISIIALIIFILLITGTITGNSVLNKENLVSIQTSHGEIVVELYPNKSPITVENFKSYAEEGFYNGTIFHRVIDGFMIQGGGFLEDGSQKKTKDPIKLESNNGLSNEKYTIAMARTLSPNSATSQFFINTEDNTFLDYTPTNQGYAVFGKVIKGQEIVDKISKVKTETKSIYENWPVENVIIEKIELI